MFRNRFRGARGYITPPVCHLCWNVEICLNNYLIHTYIMKNMMTKILSKNLSVKFENCVRKDTIGDSCIEVFLPLMVLSTTILYGLIKYWMDVEYEAIANVVYKRTLVDKIFSNYSWWNYVTTSVSCFNLTKCRSGLERRRKSGIETLCCNFLFYF